jgi:hypothetical protein
LPTIVSAPPQILLTPTVLSNLQAQAAANTPQWQAFKSRLDFELGRVIAEDIGSYQGEQLAWISDYALGYQILKNSDPTTADNYADKAIGLMKSGLNDYQKGSWVARQFLQRGDGTTRTFTLPNADLLQPSLSVYLSPIVVDKVVRSAMSPQDPVDFYLTFLKVSNTADGPADYTPGSDWQHNPTYDDNMIDWSSAAKKPAVGATYYVTAAGGLYGNSTAPYTYDASSHTITFNVAPTKNQAVFVEYVYGTHSSDGSTLAYQQTSAGDGGFNSIFIDDTYTSRFLGKHLAMGLDWLDGYVGMTQAFEQQVADMLVRWSDFVRDNGYLATHPDSNMEDGAYITRAMSALALAPRDAADGPRLMSEVLDYRQKYVLPLLQNPTTSLAGGFWAEGWHYGHNAIQNFLLAGQALEVAGQLTATAEHQWVDQVIDNLASAQSAPGLVYDGGEAYRYPFHFLDKDLFYTLSSMADNPAEQSYANYIIQNYSDSGGPTGPIQYQTPADYRDLLFHNPSAPAAFWSGLPLQNFATGTGLLTARSDWGTSDTWLSAPTSTWVSAQIGNLLAADHQTYSPGHMEINRGADQLLINANGVENQYGNHSLLPFQVSQFSNVVAVNDNGAGYERNPPNMGVWYGTPGVVDNAYEGTSDHAYLYGDYHVAYSPDTNPGSGGPTSELTRQVVYVRPNYVFVFDRVTTLQAAYSKQLRWHFAKAPTVSGNAFVETVGSSRLFGQTFSTVPITTGLSSYVLGSGTQSFRVQRLITQDVIPATRDRFVTVFQVAPSTTAAMDRTRHIVSSGSIMDGAQVGGEVVLFGRNGDLGPDTTVTYSFDGSGSVQHLLTNLLPSQAYEVVINGTINLINSSGQGTLSFTTTAGVSSVTLVADRLELTSPNTATFTVGQNGTFTFTAKGYPTPSLTETGALPSGVTFTDNGNGTATLTGTPAFGTSGTYNVTITLHNGVVPDANVSFALKVAFTNLLIHAPSQANVGQNFTATVDVVDANGNPLTAFNGSVALALSGAASGQLSGVTRVPVQNGVATFNRLSLSAAGNYTLFAASSGDLAGSTATIAAIAVTPATHFRVVAASPTTGAGQPVNVTITALDALGRVDSSYQGTVHLTSSDRQALLPGDYAFTTGAGGDNGAHTFAITLNTAGFESVTAADVTTPTARGTSTAVIVTAGNVAALSVTGFPAVDVIGVVHAFTVTAVDAFGNRVSSYRGQVQLGISGGTANLPQPYTFTAIDAGAHTFFTALTSQGSGQALTATDTSNGGITGSESGITVVSPATHLAVAIRPNTTATAGQMYSVTVTALDILGRRDSLFADTIHFSSTDPQAALPADQAFAGSNGQEAFTVTLKTAGFQTVTVTDTGRPTVKGTSLGQGVSALAATSLSVTGFPSPTLVGAVHGFTVTALDPYGNRALSYRGQVQFSVVGGPANLPQPYTFTAFDLGRHVFTADLDNAGTYSLTATDSVDASITGTQANIEVANLTGGVAGPALGVRGQPLAFTLTATEDGVPANAVFTYRIDWNGNGIVNQVVAGVSGLTVSHAYPVDGFFTPTVTVVDSARNFSGPAADPQGVGIQTLALETDPADNTKTALAIGGTPVRDVITITPADATGQVLSVSINGVVQPNGPFNPTGHILVFGQGGGDVIQLVAGTNAGQPVPITIPALLFSGGGNSVLSAAGSSANNVLVGGPGNDVLTAGSGRDIVIGGAGADTLRAGGGGDVLISGSTAYDANVAALLALEAEWSRTDIGYLARVQDLFGDGSGGLNGTFLLDPQTVTRDAAVDQIFAGAGPDWMWLSGGLTAVDKVNGYAPGETATFS